MKIVGLITEYNPFHNGHKYHLDEALRQTGADYAIVIMSGDFVQRGAPAILPKHLRAKIALDSGAAVVIELPILYATGSAELFAMGAVSILNSLNCVDYICFGSESGDIIALKQIAHILSNESVEYKTALQKHLKSGNCFPLARQKAFNEIAEDSTLFSILKSPNNILGIEYIKTLYRLNSTITPIAIQRKNSHYHDTNLKTLYSSATAIRNIFPKTIIDFSLIEDTLKKQMPPNAIPLLKSTFQEKYPIYTNDFSLLLKYRLLTETKETLLSYMDINETLANRIYKNRNYFLSFEQFCEKIKTKDLTYTRVSRALLHILLQIKKTNEITPTYARILGFRQDSSSILSILKQKSSIPLITKLSSTDLKENLSLQCDVFASDLYESAIADKFQVPFINERKKEIIRY
ncbi:nucleotidyltransferase [Faecalimonas sp.]